jgi:glycerophosphoryl diester phosphodiesterase
VVDTTWADLRCLDAGAKFGPAFAGERIPTLAEALERIAALGLGVNIEIKADEAHSAATAEVALALTERIWPDDRPVPLVSSFTREALVVAQRQTPHLPRGLLLETLPDDWRTMAAELGCIGLHVDRRRLNPDRVAAIREAGLVLLAYTVNSPEQALRLWSWGVQAVFSDRPERLEMPDTLASLEESQS